MYRSVIARAVPERGPRWFEGRYHHWDGEPTILGATLWKLYHGHFRQDLPAMLNVLIDQHPAGWSTINDKNFRKRPGFGWGDAPACYCHGRRHEKAHLIVNDGRRDIIAANGLDWAYVFDPDRNLLRILEARVDENLAAAGMLGRIAEGNSWFEAAALDLDDSTEPTWELIEMSLERIVTLRAAA